MLLLQTCIYLKHVGVDDIIRYKIQVFNFKGINRFHLTPTTSIPGIKHHTTTTPFFSDERSIMSTILPVLIILLLAKCTRSYILQTTLGPVEGNTVSKIIDGGKVVETDVYFGIPYAATTAGNNRFQSTQPRTPWTAIRNATDYGPGCPQADHNPDVPKIQSEDCLNLNIWRPTKTSSKPMSIGVFFHGGAFKEGSNRGPFDLYDGAYFSARSGVIVIAANYRIGALGFLTSNDAGLEGNFGLQDQRMALKWVQDNAKLLGGDPSQVTLWGESAGGMSGLIHMLSPASKGLFSRVIMESNPAGYIYRNIKQASDFGKGFVKDVGCLEKNGSAETTIKCLRAANISTIIKATATSNVLDIVTAVLGGAHLLDVFLPYTPTGGTTNVPNFRINSNLTFANPVPLLIGTNRNEGDTFIDAGLKSSLSKLEYNLLIDAIFGITGKNTKVKSKYPAEDDSRGSLGALVTDYWFRCASQRVSGNLAKSMDNNLVSMYWYNHSVSFGPQMWPKYNFPFCVRKVCHGAELPFVFHNSANWTLDQDELTLSDYMVDMWSDFIKHDDTSMRTNGWPAYNDTTKTVLALRPHPTVQSTLSDSLCSFWDGIGYDH